MAPPMKPLKTYSHRVLGVKELKLVASPGFTLFYAAFYESIFQERGCLLNDLPK